MLQKRPSVRSADGRDRDIGRRVRAQRLGKGMTQIELAGHLGVTFQQVQKYELGANRIGSVRLQSIAEALDMPISYFFSGDENGQSAGAGDSPLDYLKTEGTVRLVRAYSQIANNVVQQAIVHAVEHIAKLHPKKRKSGKK
jgi:transcriptional regulator with XRE-family HTH domain